jgi:hypothetical protein
LAETLGKAGVPDTVLKPLKEARSTVQTLKTEFSPETITGKLIGMKRRGVDPIIEASKVYDSLIVGKKPIEYLERTIASLEKAGPAGRLAMGDLQAATIMDLIDSAFKAETRKIQGAKTFGAVPFNKKLAQIGQDRLQLIFKTNPAALETINKVSKVAANLVPPSGAVPKGSATTILDLVTKSGAFETFRDTYREQTWWPKGLLRLLKKVQAEKRWSKRLLQNRSLKGWPALSKVKCQHLQGRLASPVMLGRQQKKRRRNQKKNQNHKKNRKKTQNQNLKNTLFLTASLYPRGPCNDPSTGAR